jgi:2-iminobutanoate/2-iminopropanoate deaminase
VCRAADARLEDAVRLTLYLTDLAGDGPAVNDVYASFFSAVADALPARAAVGVAALPLGARVEIAAVVALPG